ncbi:glycosyltransferase family 39 protein [Rhabdothermincola salaria]|uniref:glycosyltransferase family 39 protein n=1 Tax=Rhabdothermincola salaria TaxID=2903142 RepID=UPI001E380B75|nr:glycosyltransferase family 39 protein [Rhabdothermincola salaria]MCD9623005.1 glycosyltransferase family 39 protein [Rhabdothermincola salaria]
MRETRPQGEHPDERAPESPDGLGAPPEILVVALAAVAAGIVLRFVTRSALWLDEALTVNIAELAVTDLFEALRQDGHPPLYYLMLHGWMELFGTGDVAVRALSGVLGVLSLPLAFLYGRRRGGPVLGWCLTAVVALSPFALRYSTETRMYSLVVLLVLVGALLLDDVMARGRATPLRLVGIALTTAALLYTHYWAIWLLAAVTLGLGWRLWRRRGSGERGPVVPVLGAMVLGGVLYLPWVPTMLYQSANTGTPWAGPVRPTTVVSITMVDFAAGSFPDGPLVAFVVATVALLGLFGRGIDRHTIRLDLRTVPQLRPEAALVALTMVLGTVFIYATWSAYATRYAAVVLPLYFVLVAGGITRFVGRAVRVGVLVVVLTAMSIGAIWNVRDQRTQARVNAEAIASEAGPGDLVIYCPDQLGPAGSRELGDDIEQVVYPTFGDPERIDWVDYGERNTAADPDAFAAEALARAGDRGIFLVWNASYRTFETQCERLLSAIATARPTIELVPNRGGTFFEHATVSWSPPL